MQNNEHAIQEAMRIAKSSAGQQLIQKLQSSNQEALKQAVQSASEGNMDQAKTILNNLLKDPQTQALLKKLGETNG